ncbi:hypothetical protein [Nonomuraea turcica]|uniref:hypothetical protein n=1 Tax=Nonomuraea sp. G32 TaxID=3067274 RepID=UPI00273BA4B5|nr:hypothetical protein [Nonomuraea sp. G32]MDP4504663.1 hypothetical protein [Nonomuraea sp. G32]
MRVRALSTSGKALPPAMLDDIWGLTPDADYPLTTGKEYIVYAITVAKDAFWYYILDDDERPYPIWYPSPLFEVTDGTPSSRWVVSYVPPGPLTPDAGSSLIAFREWAMDHLYYERLVDGDEQAVAAFRREKALIDHEA